MPLEKPRITARIAGLALHPLLAPIAVGCFFAAFACDLVYAQATLFAPKGMPELAAIIERLLGAGLVVAGLTVFVALIDLVGERRFRSLPDLRMYAAGSALVVALEMYNLDLRHHRRPGGHHAHGADPVALRRRRPAGHAVAKLGPHVSLSERGTGERRPSEG